MDHSKKQVDDIENRIDSIIQQSSSKASRYMILTIIFMIISLFISAFFTYRYITKIDNKLNQIETNIKLSSQHTKQQYNQQPQSIPNEAIESLKERLSSLETLQEAMVSNSKGALEQMNFVFAIVATFFGLFSLFFAYRQIIADTSRDKHDEEMRGLVGSFRQNITVINDLIATLEHTHRYRQEVETRIQTMDTKIVEFDEYKKKTEQTIKEKIDELNAEAFILFRDHIDRQQFKTEENRGRLDLFYINMNAIEQMGDIGSQFSPICFFLRALHFFNITQYNPASKDLEESRRLGLREVAKPTFKNYGQIEEDDIIKQLERMLDDCSYHLGIIYFNTGQYDKSQERFKEAYRRKRLDFRSRSYIPQLMFFDTRIPFNSVITEFNTVEKELKSLSIEDQSRINWSEDMASLKMREGSCYLPKLIPLPNRAGYRDKENAEKSANLFWEAYEYAQKIAYKPSPVEIFVRFSLAQALELLPRTEWRDQTPEELFKNVFNDIRKQVITKTEPILLVLLNYSLAICANKAKISGENPHFYLNRARESLQHVPNNIMIFSPINKLNLTREEIINEMEVFEESIV